VTPPEGAQQGKPSHVKPSHVKPSHVKPGHVKPGHVKPGQVKSSHVKSSEALQPAEPALTNLRLCGANVFTLSAGKGFQFKGPLTLPFGMAVVRQVLAMQHRLHDITLRQLLEIGVLQFCWLIPGEQVGPYDGTLWPRGAFAYFYAEEHAACDCIFALDHLVGSSAIPPLRRWQASSASSSRLMGLANRQLSASKLLSGLSGSRRALSVTQSHSRENLQVEAKVAI